jgi:hypothetical protein
MDFDAVNAGNSAIAKTLMCTILFRALWAVRMIRATSSRCAMAAMPHTIQTSK